MIKYKRFQFAWIIVIVFIVFLIWMTFAFIRQWGNNPIDVYGYILFITIFTVILLTFYGITIIITDKYLKIKFGIGFYTKKIDLTSIDTLTVVKAPVCRGYGIRIIPNGLLYNLGSKQAIEIKLKRKKQVIQVGTKDIDKLKEVLETGLTA